MTKCHSHENYPVYFATSNETVKSDEQSFVKFLLNFGSIDNKK